MSGLYSSSISSPSLFLSHHSKPTRQALTRLAIGIAIKIVNITLTLAHAEVHARLGLWLRIKVGAVERVAIATAKVAKLNTLSGAVEQRKPKFLSPRTLYQCKISPICLDLPKNDTLSAPKARSVLLFMASLVAILR